MGTASRPAKIGKYDILSTLGRGGMGVVYKAHDPVIDRVVAIKTILFEEVGESDADLVDRLHMEARSAGRLHHPNIVTVFDFGDEKGLSYIVMEFVEGMNLARLIDERMTIALDAKINILAQIADGLAYAHEHNVIHRDMKPSNVCVTKKGTPKILDFGLARFDSTRLTKTGFMAGTVAYMSPERLNGEMGVKDDIFGLGAIAYELLTYQRAFPGSTAPEVMSKIITPDPPRNPSQIADLPREIDAIVQKSLAKEVEDRYDTAGQMADDLRQFARSESLREYLMDPRRKTGNQISKELIVDLSSVNPFVGPTSRKLTDEPPATMRVTAPIYGEATDVKPLVSGVRTTQPEPMSSSLATEVMPGGKSRIRWWPAAAIIAALAISVAAWIAFKPTPAPKQVPVSTSAAPKPAASGDALADRSELQLATARSLSERLSRQSLNDDEMAQFTEANARIALAERKVNARDYEGGARLSSDAIAALQAVLAANATRVQQSKPPVAKREPPVKQTSRSTSKAKIPPTTSTATPQTQTAAPMPAPQPVVETPPVVPEPRPQPDVEPAPASPAESPEKEIRAFMHQLAAAYQAKDVDFFREHVLHFTDQLANAIRNSPSVRVELQVTQIEMRDPQHARVRVKRTDWFADPKAPPGVQVLVYDLQRERTGWAIASISRN